MIGLCCSIPRMAECSIACDACVCACMRCQCVVPVVNTNTRHHVHFVHSLTHVCVWDRCTRVGVCACAVVCNGYSSLNGSTQCVVDRDG